MSKKMTPAMRLWRDENMEAVREGVRAFKEGRTMPADTFFEWMRAKYVRDIWDARITALERQLAEAQGERDALMKAGVTDYSKLTGTNRVDCHFCNGVWRTEDSAKHKSTCPLGRILSKEGNE